MALKKTMMKTSNVGFQRHLEEPPQTASLQFLWRSLQYQMIVESFRVLEKIYQTYEYLFFFSAEY